MAWQSIGWPRLAYQGLHKEGIDSKVLQWNSTAFSFVCFVGSPPSGIWSGAVVDAAADDGAEVECTGSESNCTGHRRFRVQPNMRMMVVQWIWRGMDRTLFQCCVGLFMCARQSDTARVYLHTSVSLEVR